MNLLKEQKDELKSLNVNLVLYLEITNHGEGGMGINISNSYFRIKEEAVLEATDLSDFYEKMINDIVG